MTTKFLLFIPSFSFLLLLFFTALAFAQSGYRGYIGPNQHLYTDGNMVANSPVFAELGPRGSADWEAAADPSGGPNAGFLADVAQPYWRTGQADLIGDNLIIYSGGRRPAQSYQVEFTSNGYAKVLDTQGRVVGQIDKLGPGATFRFVSHGVAVPLKLTNTLPSAVTDHNN